ncbi:MAG: hypothetical protein ACYSOX_04095 [Planctomycetota bacterium]
MNEKSSLGLFLSKDKAVAVWVSSGPDSSVVRKLNITPDEDQPAVIALQAARAVRQGDEFDEAFVAVDCASYTQYKLHSEFDDYHQVESTIKFDAEEAAATDAMNLAVAFDITGKASVGSEVTVYTADRQLLTDMLLDMQEGALDPGFMEPDVVCLARALSHCAGMSDRTDAMFVVLSQSSCYMIRSQADFVPAGRTFLIGKGQDVTGVLSREIMLAGGATDPPAQPMTSIVLMGDLDLVDADLLAQRTGLEVQTAAPENALAEVLDDGGDIAPHELMIAYGAALAGRTRGHKTDFRRDFMPYQGRRKVVQSSLRLIGVSLTILLVSVAVFFQLKTFRMRGYSRALNKKALTEYKAATFGKIPPRGMSVSSGLRRELGRAKQMEEGIGPGGDKSVPAKLTFFFEALDKTPKKVDVNVQQITITERSMKVKGDTNSRSGTLAFFGEIKKHPRIDLSSERLTAGADRRDGFDITLEPKKSETKR